jgi:hypothetical protein
MDPATGPARIRKTPANKGKPTAMNTYEGLTSMRTLAESAAIIQAAIRAVDLARKGPA